MKSVVALCLTLVLVSTTVANIVKDINMRAIEVQLHEHARKELDTRVKTIMLETVVSEMNQTATELKALLNDCMNKINSTRDECTKCTAVNCNSQSVNAIAKKNDDNVSLVLKLLFVPLTQYVTGLKVMEHQMSLVFEIIGFEEGQKILQAVGGVVDIVSNELVKGAEGVVQLAGKGLENFGKNLANIAEDIGKGLQNTVKDLNKGVHQLSEQVANIVSDIGSKAQAAAENAVQQVTETVKHISEQVGNVVSGATEVVGHVTSQVGNTVNSVVRSVSGAVSRFVRGWGKRNLKARRQEEACKDACPSCRKLDSSDTNKTLASVCGVEDVLKKNHLLNEIQRQQRIFNFTVNKNHEIVKEVKFDPAAFVITDSGLLVYPNPVVKVNVGGIVKEFNSKEPLNQYNTSLTLLPNHIADTVMKLIS